MIFTAAEIGDKYGIQKLHGHPFSKLNHETGFVL